MKKKLFSILLSLAMVVTMMPPLMVSAGEAPVEYPVIVNDTTVTSENANDVLGGTDEGATVTFTPAETGTNAKLTLNNAMLVTFINYTGKDTLDIEVIGENRVTAASQYRPSTIVTWDDPTPGAPAGNPDASLNIYGSGSLTVINEQPNSIHNDGIYANKNLTIKGITLTVKANNTDCMTEYNRAIHAGNDIIIDGAKVKATAGVSNKLATNAFCAGHDVIIKNGADVTAEAGDSTKVDSDSVAIFASHDVKISGSDTKVSASSGKGFNSCGISAYNAVTICGGTVKATAGTAIAASVGILAKIAITIKDCKVTAKAGNKGLLKAKTATGVGIGAGVIATTVGTIHTIKAIKSCKAKKATEILPEAKALVEATAPMQNDLVAKKNGIIVVSYVGPELEGVLGYEIERATDKDFTKNVVTYKNKKLVRYNLMNLKKGTTYFYRVRAKVKLADGSIAYTDWSNAKSIKATRTR